MSARVPCGSLRCVLVAVVLLVSATPAHGAPSPPTVPQDRQGCIPAPSTTAVTTPWPQTYLAWQRVWDITRGQGVTVAVVDTGVDASSPQLHGRVRAGVDVVSAGAEHANEDCLGHGTFVAGIIGAAPASDTAFVGVAPAVSILPVRVATTLKPDKPGSLTPGSLAAGITAAVDAGAEVINVSAGTTAASPELAEAVRYALAHDVVLVASVANVRKRGTSVTYPAAYHGVIAVGAIDSDGTVTDFSARGDFVDLVAPGKNVVSIGAGGPGHWQGSGTSYAAAFVSGTVALVRSRYPDLTVSEVAHRLQVTATQPVGQLPDTASGAGIVAPAAAVTAILRGRAGETVHPPTARLPVREGAGQLGALLAVTGALGAVTLIAVFGWVTRLSASACRRRWRRARVLRADDSVL